MFNHIVHKFIIWIHPESLFLIYMLGRWCWREVYCFHRTLLLKLILRYFVPNYSNIALCILSPKFLSACVTDYSVSANVMPPFLYNVSQSHRTLQHIKIKYIIYFDGILLPLSPLTNYCRVDGIIFISPWLYCQKTDINKFCNILAQKIVPRTITL